MGRSDIEEKGRVFQDEPEGTEATRLVKTLEKTRHRWAGPRKEFPQGCYIKDGVVYLEWWDNKFCRFQCSSTGYLNN